MDSTIKTFEVGRRYTHEEVYRSLGVGNAGGIRPCIGESGEVRRLVLMTTAPDARILRENPYHDRIEADFLVYTAAGLEGNQAVAGINRRLIEQFQAPYPIYGFSNTGSRRDRTLGQKRWEFLGLLQYIRHYREFQVDSHQKGRDAWVFEMLIHRESGPVPVDHDNAIMAELLAKSETADVTDEGERRIQRKEIPGATAKSPEKAFETEVVRRKMLALPPELFEHLIKDVLISTGFSNVTVTRYTQDGGIDVNAYVDKSIWAVRDLHVQVQAKRWLHTVGRRDVAEMRGSIEPLARGSIVTTSFFSRAAVTESSATGKSPIVLVDGTEFAEIVGGLRIDIG